MPVPHDADRFSLGDTSIVSFLEMSGLLELTYTYSVACSQVHIEKSVIF